MKNHQLAQYFNQGRVGAAIMKAWVALVVETSMDPSMEEVLSMEEALGNSRVTSRYQCLSREILVAILVPKCGVNFRFGLPLSCIGKWI